MIFRYRAKFSAMAEVNRDKLRALVKGDAGGRSAAAISVAAGLGSTAIKDILSGKSRDPGAGTISAIASQLGVSTDALMDNWPGATTAPDAMIPIRGFVGADPSGRILFAEGQESGDMAPAPPPGSDASVVEVRGHSMKGFADDGSLIYYENQRSRPDKDMLGEIVVVQTVAGEILVKRLLKGSRAGVYDLESIAGPTMGDVEIEWVAEIAYIMPPLQARRRIVRRGTEAA